MLERSTLIELHREIERNTSRHLAMQNNNGIDNSVKSVKEKE